MNTGATIFKSQFGKIGKTDTDKNDCVRFYF